LSKISFLEKGKRVIDRKKYILDLEKEIKKFNQKINNTNTPTINILQYKRDNLLCKFIQECKPPFFIKQDFFNYRAILLYFIENFTNNIVITIPNTKEKINIITTTDNLFHLLNIPNKNNYLQKEKIHSKIIYDILEFKNYGENPNNFKPKVASIGWVKDTLKYPDFIYNKDANISKNLKFDYLFVREVGKGTKFQPYMYHLVAIKKRKKSYGYVINSQFPIEKDKIYSSSEKKISRLHNFVHCEKAIFNNPDKNFPKSRKDLDTNDLKNKFRG